MKKLFKKENKLLIRWSYLGILCFLMWQGIELYSVAHSSHDANEMTGQVYIEVYKGDTHYITLAEYILIRALPVCGFLVLIVLSIVDRIQSRKEIEGYFKIEKRSNDHV